MATSGLHDEILKAAEYTVSVGNQRLGKTLDYSVNSLENVDSVIEYVKKQVYQLSKEGKPTDTTIQRASMSIGSYIGEVIRQQHGGICTSKNNSLFVQFANGIEVSPVFYVFQRLTMVSEKSVQVYWFDIIQQLYTDTHLKSETDTKTKIAIDTESKLEIKKDIIEEQKKPNASNNKNKTLFIVGGLGIVILCLLIGLGYSIFSSNQAANEAKANVQATNVAFAKFNTDYNAFLVEGQKLSIMTEQGVTNNDFRNQLAEVKSRYASIGNSWPSSYLAKRHSFDLALQGWDLTLEVWDIEIDGGIFIADGLAEKVASYLGVSPSSITSVLTKDLVGVIMVPASDYFNKGKGQ